MRRLTTLIASAKKVHVIALGTLCAVGAFAGGIETAGDVHPFGRSEAALHEIVTEGADVHGDVNGNGSLDAGDAFVVSQALDGMIELTQEQANRADVNGDFRVDDADLKAILYTLSLR